MITKLPLRLGSTFLFALSLSTLSYAQTSWTGGGANSNWSNPQNWDNNLAPISSGTSQLYLTGTSNTSININTPFTFQQLTVNAGSGPFTLSGSQFTINGASTDLGTTLRNNATSLLTINNDIQLTGGSGFFAASGNITLNGNIDLNGQVIRILAGGSRTFTLNGAISGTVAGTGVAYNNGGSFVIAGANTYSASTSIWKATVYIASDSAFGLSTNAVSMGANANDTYNPKILTNGSYTVANDIRLTTNTYVGKEGTFTLGGTQTNGTSLFSGNITMGSVNNAAVGATLTADGGGRVNFTGNFLRNSGATGTGDFITKAGAGTVALSGTVANHGIITVDAGRLIVNGSIAAGGGDITVNSAATLGGAGGNISRNVTLNSGAFLEVGDNTASTAGELTINGNLSLLDNTTIKLDLASSQANSDRLTVNGLIILGTTVTIELTALNTLQESSYTLVTASEGFIGDPNSILFTGYDFSASDYQLMITENSISLAIPEPTTILLGGAGLLALFGMTRSRRFLA